MKPRIAAVFAQPVDAKGNQLLARDEGPSQARWSIRILGCSAAHPLSPQGGSKFQVAALDGPLQLSRDGTPCSHLQRLQTITISDQGMLATPTEGATRIFCLRQHASQHALLLLRPLLDHMMLPSSRARWFVHALAGSVTVSTGSEQLCLEMNQSAWLSTAPGQRALIEGGGELALVQLPE